jgi:hypothetical protein
MSIKNAFVKTADDIDELQAVRHRMGFIEWGEIFINSHLKINVYSRRTQICVSSAKFICLRRATPSRFLTERCKAVSIIVRKGFMTLLSNKRVQPLTLLRFSLEIG